MSKEKYKIVQNIILSERSNNVVDAYLLPTDEVDFIWGRYGDDKNYANILIEGGTKSCGQNVAKLLSLKIMEEQ